MDVADVEAGSAVHAGPSAHQLLEQDVVSEGDVEHSVDREDLSVLLQLSKSPGESVKDDSLLALRLLDLLLDDLRNDLITDQSSRLDNPPDLLYQILVEATRDSALEDLADLITS